MAKAGPAGGGGGAGRAARRYGWAAGRPAALDPAAFGASLRRHRAARGWSQREAAEQAGVGLATVQRAEDGAGVYLETAVRLASAYRTGLDTLLAADGTT